MADALSPVETLRAAAARLRELAKGTTPGPWGVIWEHRVAAGAKQLDDETAEYKHFVAELDSHDRDEHDIPNPYEPAADAAWIALVHPGIAEPLADWLDQEAHFLTQTVESTYVEDDPTSVPEHYHRPLAVARVLLGVPDGR